MNRQLFVRPWRKEETSGVPYDVLFAAAGYERRARYISENLSPGALRRVALGFADRHVHAFRDNVNWYKTHGFEYLEADDATFIQVSDKIWTDIESRDDNELRVCIDISSLSRFRIATLTASLLKLRRWRSISVSFMYAIAEYCDSPMDFEPIVTASPVLPLFAGWSPRTDLPTVAIIGLGYEPDKAVGAYEFIEATSMWAFLPFGEDSRFDKALKRANASLLSRVAKERLIRYRVDQPFSCFASLESLTFGAKTLGRPVLLPFGPKVFALCCLLVGCVHRELSVWRISGGNYSQPIDQVASGKVVGLRVSFANDQDIDHPRSC